jgi:hypothetical protein
MKPPTLAQWGLRRSRTDPEEYEQTACVVHCILAAYKLLLYSPHRYIPVQQGNETTYLTINMRPTDLKELAIVLQKGLEPGKYIPTVSTPFMWFIEIKEYIDLVYRRRYVPLHDTVCQPGGIFACPPVVDQKLPGNRDAPV